MTHLYRRRLLSLAAALGLLAGCTSGITGGFESEPEDLSVATVPPVAPAPVNELVKRVVDGDSLEIMLDGNEEDLRLRGVNAPERFTCGGPEAAQALEDVLFPEGVAGIATIELVVDPDEPRDRFGRVLAEVLVDGQNVAGQLVADGFVIPLGGSSSRFHEQARQASEQRLGVWSPERCGPTIPGLVIESFVPNPDGPDDRPGAGEFIELRNALDTDLDLAGWVVHDESTSNRFEFASGTVAAGERFRLYSTCGDGTHDADDLDAFYMCDTDSVWNNAGDTAFVEDPNGNVADFRFSP